MRGTLFLISIRLTMISRGFNYLFGNVISTDLLALGLFMLLEGFSIEVGTIAVIIHLKGNVDFMFSNTGLEAFLRLSFLVGDNLVGATSLGDHPGGYSEREMELFSTLSEIGGLLIAADRNRGPHCPSS